jgi:CPA1 family monovalent cation:H+ antiporter
MRGVVTVATALALPQAVDDGAPFPGRGRVILVALLVVIGTLLVQGLTLAPLIRRLGVASEVDVRMDVRRLHRIATEAALDQVRRADDVPDPVREAVLRQYESRLTYRQRVLDLVDGDDAVVETGRQLRGLLARATEAEREAVLDARRHGEVSPAAADDVLFDVEARALRYEQ